MSLDGAKCGEDCDNLTNMFNTMKKTMKALIDPCSYLFVCPSPTSRLVDKECPVRVSTTATSWRSLLHPAVQNAALGPDHEMRGEESSPSHLLWQVGSEVEVAGKSMNILQSLNVCLPSPHSIFPILSRFWDPAVVSQPRGMSRSRRNLVSRCSWCSHTAPSPSGSSEHPYPRAYSLTRQQLPHPGCWTSSIAKPKVVDEEEVPTRALRATQRRGHVVGTWWQPVRTIPSHCVGLPPLPARMPPGTQLHAHRGDGLPLPLTHIGVARLWV
jgi:hypothetical protein